MSIATRKKRPFARVVVVAVLGALALAGLLLADSKVLQASSVVSGPRVERELERRAPIPLAKVPSPEAASTMANVAATYSGQARGQRLLVVVFDSRDAVVQISRQWNLPFADRGRAFRRKNVVVLYTHERGTPDLGSAVSAALAAAAG